MTALTDPVTTARTCINDALVALDPLQDDCPPGLRARLNQIGSLLSSMKTDVTGPMVRYRRYSSAGETVEVFTGRLVFVDDNAHGDLHVLMADGQYISRSTTTVQGADLCFDLERVAA